VPPSIMIV